MSNYQGTTPGGVIAGTVTTNTQGIDLDKPEDALAAITNRLALAYRICCGTAPKQSVGELLDVTIKMPEWEIVRAGLARQAAPEAPTTGDKPAKLPWRITDSPRKIVGADGAVVANLTALDLPNAELIVASVNQSAATTASASTQQQLNVSPPMRGTGGQHDACAEVLSEDRIEKLWSDAAVEAIGQAGFGVGNGDVAYMLRPVIFARAIEAEVVRRCCAQRESKPSSNSIASNAADQGEKN